MSGKSELRQDNGRGPRARVGAKNDGVTAHWTDRLMGRQTTDALDDILRAERAE